MSDLRPRFWLAALLALTALRMLVAAFTPLSADEAYYWVWSRALAPGYLDHPPMVAWWIWAGTQAAGDGALGIRLLSPLSAAAGSLLLARTAEMLLPGRQAGIVAACLLNATLLLGVGAVTVTPDTPLILFWTAALWAMAQVLRTGQGGWWLLVGLAAGCALLSKYTALLLGVGIVIWLVVTPSGRVWLRTPWPWLGGVVAGLVFLPVVGWNASHGWASFIKQGARTSDWQPGRALVFLGELAAGQVGLATPLVLVLCGAGAWAALRHARRLDPAWTLLAALIWPGIAIFVQHALGDRVQANWPAVIYPAAAIAAAGLGWRLWKPAAALGLAMTALVYAQATLGVIPLPRRADVTLFRLAGWDQLAAEAAAARQASGAKWIAAEEYGLASQLSHALPGTDVAGVAPRWAFFRLPPADAMLRSGPGLLVQSTRRREPPEPGQWRGVEIIGQIWRGRRGVEAERYTLYRVEAYTGGEASALLPHR